MYVSRRSFLLIFPAAGVLPVSSGDAQAVAAGATPASFPSHDPALAREMVSVAHGNVVRVKELLAGRSAIANASWDWGYGDWESALGAASHVGDKEIALLIAAGARPSISRRRCSASSTWSVRSRRRRAAFSGRAARMASRW